jgi:hypothetical protein
MASPVHPIELARLPHLEFGIAFTTGLAAADSSGLTMDRLAATLVA